MTKYLTIGEVAKIKDINIKSLRYYDKVGIFKPTYVNPDTKYRYYTLDQLFRLEIIMYMVKVGIPLRNFYNYVHQDESLNIALLLEDGKRIINEKMEELTRMNEGIQLYTQLANENCGLMSQKEVRVKQLPTKYYLRCLTTDLSPISAGNTKLITILFKELEANNYRFLFNEGIMKVKENEREQHYVFLEIAKPDALTDHIFVLESTPCRSKILMNITEETYKYHYLDHHDDNIVILRQLVDLNIDIASDNVEILYIK